MALHRRWPLACRALSILLIASAAARATAAVPEVTFRDLQGGPHTLSEFRGRVVLVEFWASWCAPCRKSFPFFNELQEQHRAAGLAVVGLNLEEDDAAVDGFLAAVPPKFLIGRDPSGASGEACEVTSMPTSIVFDREGREVARFAGGTAATHEEIAAAVEGVLQGRAPATGVIAAGRARQHGGLRAWERNYLADPIMSLDGDPLARLMKDHVHSSKEAAAGNGGLAGGGCGCN